MSTTNLQLWIYHFFTTFCFCLLMVTFFQKVLIHFSLPQTYEPFNFLSLKIWILVTGICLEIEDVFKFDSLEACNGKQAKNNKTSNFQVQDNKSFMYLKKWKCITTSWEKATFKGLQICFLSVLISIENSYLIEK